jgi:hypothetical protein
VHASFRSRIVRGEVLQLTRDQHACCVEVGRRGIRYRSNSGGGSSLCMRCS